jgi:hypothetical protein
MSVDFNPSHNNPYQERQDGDLTIGQAMRIIAERTAFRSEHEQNQVLAAIDRANETESGDEPDPEDAKSDGGDPPPAKTTPARAKR